MTPTQFALTLYAICGLSTLGIYAVNASRPRTMGVWYGYAMLAASILVFWPLWFAIAMWVAADLKPAGKRWRAP